jgi:hypothetical protein
MAFAYPSRPVPGQVESIDWSQTRIAAGAVNDALTGGL